MRKKIDKSVIVVQKMFKNDVMWADRKLYSSPSSQADTGILTQCTHCYDPDKCCQTDMVFPACLVQLQQQLQRLVAVRAAAAAVVVVASGQSWHVLSVGLVVG